jgi:hypothetical protein
MPNNVARSSIIECVGVAPPGYRGWLFAGTVYLDADRSARLRLGDRGLVAVSPPRWSGSEVQICAIDDSGDSLLLRLSRGGPLEPVPLPRGAIDAVGIEGGWSVSSARVGDGHVDRILEVSPLGQIRASWPVDPGWRTAGEQLEDGARWVLSRRGRRFRVEARRGQVTTIVEPWPSAAWSRGCVRVDGLPAVPTWLREVPRPERVWVALHGGPGMAWDAGPPGWLDEAAGSNDVVLLLETPGSVGYGAGLLRWGHDPGRATTFVQVLTSTLATLRRRWPGVPIALVGESDGAWLVHLAVFAHGLRPDLLALVNGEYEALPRTPRTGVRTLLVVSTQDVIVDVASAYALHDLLLNVSERVVLLEVDDGHRWTSSDSATRVAAAMVEWFGA